MFLILFAAVLGGMASLAVLTPYFGVLIAVGAAPFGGSLLAVIAGAFLAWRSREPKDEMVTSLWPAAAGA